MDAQVFVGFVLGFYAGLLACLLVTR